MTLIYESGLVAVHHGDALRILPTLPAASVDAIITDPPYSSGGQYRGDRTADPLTKYFPADSPTRRLSTFVGDNRDQRSFLLWSAMWLDEALRVARPGAVLAVCSDWRQLPTMTDAIQIGGWTWRGIVPWRKPNPRPQLARFSAACEYLVWATAGGRPTDYPADTLHGFVEADPPRDRLHPTQKPLEIFRHVVRIAPVGGVVLDPFAGSGTTGAAALLEGRRALLVERMRHFADVCADRLREVEAGPRNPAAPTLFDEDMPA